MALTLGGFVVSIVERDRVAAVEAFEAALGVSPSSAFTYLLGGAPLGWAGEAERAITWGERGSRLSPVDLPFGPFIAISLGNFQLQHYTEAANAARRAIQANPGFTACHVLFAAALAKSGGSIRQRRRPRTRWRSTQLHRRRLLRRVWNSSTPCNAIV